MVAEDEDQEIFGEAMEVTEEVIDLLEEEEREVTLEGDQEIAGEAVEERQEKEVEERQEEAVDKSQGVARQQKAEEEMQAALQELQQIAEDDGDGIDKVIRSRAADLVEISHCRHYSNYPRPKTKPQVAEIIIATKLGLRQQGDQQGYQKKVFEVYRTWRKTGFQAQDINTALDEALVVKRKIKEQAAIWSFFSPGAKPAARLSPQLLANTGGAVSSAGRSKKVKAKRRLLEAPLTANAGEPNIVQLSQALGSSKLLLSSQELGDLEVLAKVALIHYNEYKEKRLIHENMRCYSIEESQFVKDLASAAEVSDNLKFLLDKGEEYRRELNEDLALASTFDKERVAREGREKVDQVTKDLKIQLLECTKVLETATKVLKKRIYEKQRLARGQDKKDVVLLEQNTSKSWEECLDSITELKKAFGCTMTIEDFEKVSEYAELAAREGRTSMKTEDLIVYMGKSPEDARGLQRLLTENLPIIHYSTNIPGIDARMEEVLCDARAILSQPRLLVNLYQDLAFPCDGEVLEPPAKAPRLAGSGRPKGKRYFSQCFVSKLVSPVIYAGTRQELEASCQKTSSNR